MTAPHPVGGHTVGPKIELVRRSNDAVVCRIPCLSFDDGARKIGLMLDHDHRFGDWRDHYARECSGDLPNLSLWSNI